MLWKWFPWKYLIRRLAASHGMLDPVQQRYLMDRGRLAVETSLMEGSMRLSSVVELRLHDGIPVLHAQYSAQSRKPSRLVVALRPFNPEGVSFVNKLKQDPENRRWIIDEAGEVEFGEPVEDVRVSTFRNGDVFNCLDSESGADDWECDAGMLSAAALFNIKEGSRRLGLTVDVSRDPGYDASASFLPFAQNWSEALKGTCRFHVPDDRFGYLFDASIRSLVLHSPLDVYPGPFYYKRFWFRDAVMILNALMSVGFHDRAERIIDRFGARQTAGGYFRSQHGEWDSNGQVLWIFNRFRDLAGREIPERWVRSLVKGGEWLRRKRLPVDSDALHRGLLPAGFSAEHLGNNDYYYWDDFWAIAGLRAAAVVLEVAGDRAGCMGDGQHVWASAGWVMMMRNMFVREEAECLIIGQGIPRAWIERGETMGIGPVHTSFGSVTVDIFPRKTSVDVKIEACWRDRPGRICFHIPGTEAIDLEPGARMEVEVPIHADK